MKLETKKIGKNSKEVKVEKIIKLAKSLLGKPYKYGAKPEKAPELFDCSSFVQYLFAFVGIKLPRCTINQVEQGKKVDLKDIKKGDLIFFKGTKARYNKKHPDGIGHVGIFIGKGGIIHASGRIFKRKVVQEDLKKVIKRSKFRCVRRIL